MRSKKAIFNMIASISNEVVVVICGLVLPRLILSHFGSAYNGITSSITQFLQCVVLLRAGVGAVTRASLYKPLADKSPMEISAIINATDKFMKKIALIFLGALFVFAFVYPLLVKENFEYLFALTLVLILGISTFIQYYFGLTYQFLLEADQKQYVFSSINIFTTILNTCLAALFIKLGGGIHIVKLGSAFAFSLNPIIIHLYTRKKYKIDKSVPPNNSALSQKWNAFAQTVAFFVHSNTDVMILTVLSNVKEVSVYSVYNYVIANIRVVVNTFVTGFGAAFGNMIAKGEHEAIRKNLKIYEMIIFGLTSVIYTTAGIMIVPFALVYTSGVNDVNYSRPLFALIATIAGAFSCFRIPYQTIVEAAGKFKETRNGAIIEATMNILISIVLVHKYGLVGVAIGTLFATVFRTFQYALYLSKNLIKRSPMIFIGHILLNAVIAGATFAISKFCFTFDTPNLLWWVIKAACVALTSLVLSAILHIIFFKKETMLMIEKVMALINAKLHK